MSLSSLLASALSGAVTWLPVVDALALAWEVGYRMDPDMAETIAILQVRRHAARRQAEAAS